MAWTTKKKRAQKKSEERKGLKGIVARRMEQRELSKRTKTSIPDESRKRAEPSQEWQKAYRKALKDYGSDAQAERIATASVSEAKVGQEQYGKPHTPMESGRKTEPSAGSPERDRPKEAASEERSGAKKAA